MKEENNRRSLQLRTETQLAIFCRAKWIYS